jgi:streptomycin 6-kinase
MTWTLSPVESRFTSGAPGRHDGVMTLGMPRNLMEAVEADGRQVWLATVPATVKAAQERWSLESGEPFQPGGQTAWVAPDHGGASGDVVLKVAWRHPEAEHEADGLRVRAPCGCWPPKTSTTPR